MKKLGYEAVPNELVHGRPWLGTRVAHCRGHNGGLGA